MCVCVVCWTIKTEIRRIRIYFVFLFPTSQLRGALNASYLVPKIWDKAKCLIFNLIILYAWIFWLCRFMLASHKCSAHGGQKRASKVSELLVGLYRGPEPFFDKGS